MSKPARRVTRDLDVVDEPADVGDVPDATPCGLIRIDKVTSVYHRLTPQQMFDIVNAACGRRYRLLEINWDARFQAYLLLVTGEGLPLVKPGDLVPLLGAYEGPELVEPAQLPDRIDP